MKKNKLLLAFIFIVAGLLFFSTCKTYNFRSNYQNANGLLYESKQLQTKPFLKAHLKNGDVCIMRDNWQIDTQTNVLSGEGATYDFNREKARFGAVSIPVDSVAIFETNTKILKPEKERIAALTILTAVDIIVGIICLTNPKACFGSCPTFYINPDQNFHFADAEGFTRAITPSMEYTDIDALKNAPIRSTSFSLTMKNEALETHCVKEIKLLAFPKKEGEHIYQSPTDNFYLSDKIYNLTGATADEGKITGLLLTPDHNERFSLSDPENLSSREEIFLNFAVPDKPVNPGLVLDFRQTLMTTYLFYSAMGFMGDNVSDVFARMERDSVIRRKFDGTTKELGKIDVYEWNELNNTWEMQGQFSETGPIAINRQILPLTGNSGNGEIRLKLLVNKGLWRLDYAGLASIVCQADPIEILPDCVVNKGKLDDEALKNINDPDKYLISMPGSEYRFNFSLPLKNTDYELFLSSKGYYLEWMRQNWIKDKNLMKLRQMVVNPKEFLKQEAWEYKQYETVMEKEFWNTKIDTRLFSYHEN